MYILTLSHLPTHSLHTPMRTLPLLLVLMLLTLAATGCTNDTLLPSHELQVTATNLPEIGNGAYYELWVGVPAGASRAKADHVDNVEHGNLEYVSTGRFVVDDQGKMSNLDGGPATFNVPDDVNPNIMAEAILTVESGEHTEPGSRLLGGVFTGDNQVGTAKLVLNSDDGISGDFASDDAINASGSYVLETPTSADPNDYNHGIWFVRFLPGGQVEPSLTLPTLPVDADQPGWEYEAWVVRRSDLTAGGVATSLGRFSSTDMPDADGAGPDAGPLIDSAYAAPGEDFVTGDTLVLDNSIYHVVVSLQPQNVAMTRPLLTVLSNEQIPSPIGYRESDTLTAATNLPVVGIRIER